MSIWPVSNRGLWRGVGLVLLAATAAAAQDQAQPVGSLPAKMRMSRPPNIVFILADDLGYGDVGCYGQTKIKTPNIDGLAAEGMRFTQCYAGSTVCAPSRATLMTGWHTGHARIRGNNPVPLAPEDVTIAEVLKDQGYQTGAIGKWGLGLQNTTGTPHRQGFEEWFGYLDQTHAHDYFPTYLYRSSTYDEIFDAVHPLEKNLDGKKGLYSHDYFTFAATNYIRISRFKPFFLYLALTLPHANNELNRKNGGGMEVPGDEPYSKELWPQPEKNKAAMITRLDHTVGTVLEQLKALKLDTNTVVFFSSDNGPHKEGSNDPSFFKSSGPLRGIKRDLYKGGIRVPMIVRWPGRIAPGSVSDLVWSFWDFLPTAAELAGAQPPQGIDGISILPTLLGREQTVRHEFLYWEFHEGATKQAVRMGDWKGIRLAPGQPLALYNLASDPGESLDIASQQPEIVAKINDYLQTARTESEHWPIKSRKDKTADPPSK